MIFEKLKKIISDNCTVQSSKITADSNFEDLKIDSLSELDIIMEIEDEFNINIDTKDQVKNIGELVVLIQEKQKKNNKL